MSAATFPQALAEALGVDCSTADVLSVNLAIQAASWPVLVVRRQLTPQAQAQRTLLERLQTIERFELRPLDPPQPPPLDTQAMADAAMARVHSAINFAAMHASNAITAEAARLSCNRREFSLDVRASWRRELAELQEIKQSLQRFADAIASAAYPPINTQRGHTTLLQLAGVLCMALALAWLGPLLDAQADHSMERALADDLLAAQHQQARTLRRDMAAAALCRQQHGEAAFTWTADDRLVCIPRRGAGRALEPVALVGDAP